VPGRKHLQGAGSKEQGVYEHIKEHSESNGRYGKRAQEVAARTVMEHHRDRGHGKGK
jgi:hypothetical protein